MGHSESKQNDENNLEMLNASFLWKIKNYSKVPDGNWFKSPPFTISTLSYHLELRRGDDLQIRLNGVQTSVDALKFRCRISILDQLGNGHHTKVKEVTVKKESDDEAILTVKGDDLKKEKNMRSLLFDDKLIISFKIIAMNDTEPSGEDSAAFLETLSSDLGKFYVDKTNTDSVLKIHNKQFPVHRAVLSARSKVFEAMFRHDTSESRSGIVNIMDVDEKILEKALYYIYTGTVSQLTADVARALYVIADKYALAELKEECIKSLISNLTVDNVCKAALVADCFEIESLKSAIVTLVHENRGEVLRSAHWKTFSSEKPSIANSILSETLLATKN